MFSVNLAALLEPSALTATGATLAAIAGLASWLFPSNVAAICGMKESPMCDATAIANVRCQGVFALAWSAQLLVDPLHAAVLSYLITGIALLASIVPMVDAYAIPRGPMVAWLVTLAALGKLAASGAISPWVSIAIHAVQGTQSLVMPRQMSRMYGITVPISLLANAIWSILGGHILASGTYLCCLLIGLSQPMALAASFGAQALFALKWAVYDAGRFGVPESGPLCCSAICAGIAAAALRSALM